MRKINKKTPIIFRETVSGIPSTTYGTFSIYSYPAKFIPQVIAYVLENYAKPGMSILDPFAGYGTVGVVARIYGYDYELWDLNPILDTIHKTAIMKAPAKNVSSLISAIKNSKKNFIPKWSNLKYWFPEEFLPTISKTWGFINSLTNKDKHLLLIPSLKVTRYFSYSDEKIHKLYKSKHSKKKVKELFKIDWKSKFYLMLEDEIRTLLKKTKEYAHLNPKSVNSRIKSGIDTLQTELDHEVNILITSPPYLQAQEYIRSTKLELFWLGYDEDYIRDLSKKEIPYRSVKNIEIHSKNYHRLRQKIREKHLRELYDRYFQAILNTFTNLGKNVRDYMFIFVGPATIRGIQIPIDSIVIDHLTNFGWKHEDTLVDKIVSHSMFKSNVNPASGIKNNRIETEHLIVLKKLKNRKSIINAKLKYEV